MVPNNHIHEQLMLEQIRERQRQSEQQRLLAYLRKPRLRYIQYVMKGSGLSSWHFISIRNSLNGAMSLPLEEMHET